MNVLSFGKAGNIVMFSPSPYAEMMMMIMKMKNMNKRL